MKIEEFIFLTEDQKMAVLWREAKIIAERKEHRYNLFLYQIYSFYIEVWFSHNLLDIYHLRPFSNIDELDPYLEKIDISSVIY